MTKRKDTKIVSLADEAQFERLLYEACRTGGWLFATTESDVAREEKRQESEPIDIPAELEDPTKTWQRARRPITANKFAPKINEEAMENLARAARGGNPIPKEVEERMHRDREKAEKIAGDEL
jgi:hypothetical protein